MLWALAFIGSAASGSVNEKTILALLILAFWYMHATTTNDFADLEIDKINLKSANDRPLVSGLISKRQLWIIHSISALMTLFLAQFYGLGAVVLTIVMFAIDYTYSLRPFRLSDRGIIAQLVLSFAYVFYPLSIGYWSVSEGTYPWTLAIGIYIAFVARMLLKDFRDVEGDEAYGKRTFLIRHGRKKTIYLSLLLWLLSTIVIGWYGRQLAIYAVLFVGIMQIFLLSRYLLTEKSQAKQQLIITFIAKAANAIVITILAFLVSKSESTVSNIELNMIVLSVGGVLLIFNWLRYQNYDNILTRP